MLAFLAPPKGVLDPLRTSDCTIAVFSGGLGSTECEALSMILVATELRKLGFELERTTYKRTRVCVRSVLAFSAFLRVCWSRPVYLTILS